MRITVTIDDDVAAPLAQASKSTTSKRKDLINSALREGLGNMLTTKIPRKLFRTTSVSLGKCLIENIDDTASVLEMLEAPDYERLYLPPKPL